MSEVQHSPMYWVRLTIAAIILISIFFGCDFLFSLIGLIDPWKFIVSMFSTFVLFFGLGTVCSKMNDRR